MMQETDHQKLFKDTSELNIMRGERFLWNLPSAAREHVRLVASSCNLSLACSAILVKRGLVTKTDVMGFLFTSQERDVHDATLLKDAQKACDRILSR